MGRRRLLSILPVCLMWATLSSAPALAQQTVRVSVDSLGVEANAISGGLHPSQASDDGRYIVFESDADNLVIGDTNFRSDVFVHDLLTGITSRVSVSSAGEQGDHDSFQPAISAEGRLIAFITDAGNLAPGGVRHANLLMVHDRWTGVTREIDRNLWGFAAGGCETPHFSGSGRFLAFSSSNQELVPGDTNGEVDIFVCELTTGAITRVNVGPIGVEANDRSFYPQLNEDGTIVTFYSNATNLVPGDFNGEFDVFVHDRASGVTSRVSVSSTGTEGDGVSSFPRLSRDGRVVAFISAARNLVGGDTNGHPDVFTHDRSSGVTTRVSVRSNGAQANNSSRNPWISADGRFVTFESSATNLISADLPWQDVFLHDRANGQTVLASVPNSGGAPLGDSYRASITPNARFVVFHSGGTNVVPGDSNNVIDVFRYDRGVNLLLSGTCPGTVNFEVLGVQPRALVALLGGNPGGTSVKPTPPCQGLVINLLAPRVLALLRASLAGSVSLPLNVPATACGRKLLAVDLGTCSISNTLFL